MIYHQTTRLFVDHPSTHQTPTREGKSKAHIWNDILFWLDPLISCSKFWQNMWLEARFILKIDYKKQILKRYTILTRANAEEL